MKRVLITGSEGFVGTHLWTELEKNGYEVFGTALQNNFPKGNEKIIQCDITDEQSTSSLLSSLQPDYIVHLAAISSPAMSFKIPRKTLEVNALGTLNLLEVVRSISSFRPRILVVGTSDEYGPVKANQLPVTEASALNPVNPYSISKVAGYFLSKMYSHSYHMNIIYACAFNHTGPGQLQGFLASDVALQIVNIERGIQSNPLLTGNLDTQRDISDVRDVVRAYRLLLEKGISGEKYNICSGRSTPVLNVVEILTGLSSIKIERQIDPLKNRPSDMPIMYGSHQKITGLTGWIPTIPLEQTLKDLLEWYRSQPSKEKISNSVQIK